MTTKIMATSGEQGVAAAIDGYWDYLKRVEAENNAEARLGIMGVFALGSALMSAGNALSQGINGVRKQFKPSLDVLLKNFTTYDMIISEVSDGGGVILPSIIIPAGQSSSVTFADKSFILKYGPEIKWALVKKGTKIVGSFKLFNANGSDNAPTNRIFVRQVTIDGTTHDDPFYISNTPSSALGRDIHLTCFTCYPETEGKSIAIVPQPVVTPDGEMAINLIEVKSRVPVPIVPG